MLKRTELAEVPFWVLPVTHGNTPQGMYNPRAPVVVPRPMLQEQFLVFGGRETPKPWGWGAGAHPAWAVVAMAVALADFQRPT